MAPDGRSRHLASFIIFHFVAAHIIFAKLLLVLACNREWLLAASIAAACIGESALIWYRQSCILKMAIDDGRGVHYD